MNDLAVIAGEINQEHEACEAAFSDSLNHARRAGELLVEAKGKVKHGEWLPWLEENCQFAVRTAQVYMRIERNWGELANTQDLAHLGVESATRLLAKPHDIPLERHEINTYLPPFSDDEYAAFLVSIAEVGQINPIDLYEGKVLDGWHRYKACRSLGKIPVFREYEGDDPLGYFCSMNFIRSHLTEGQKAAIAAKLVSQPTGDPASA